MESFIDKASAAIVILGFIVSILLLLMLIITMGKYLTGAC